MPKQVKAQAQQPTVKQAIASAAVQAAFLKGAGSAEAVMSEPKGVKVSHILTKRVHATVQTFTATNETIGKAQVTQRDAMLADAQYLAASVQRPVYDDDGMTGLGATYMECFRAEWLKARGLKKPDSYTHTIVSQARAVILAVQHGAGVTLEEKDGEKLVKTKLGDRQAVIAKLKEQGGFSGMVRTAQAIKKAANVGKTANSGNKPMKAATAIGAFTRRFPAIRLNADSIMALQGELFKVTAKHIKAGNKEYWEQAATAYAKALAQCMVEGKADSGDKPAVIETLRQQTEEHIKGESEAARKRIASAPKAGKPEEQGEIKTADGHPTGVMLGRLIKATANAHANNKGLKGKKLASAIAAELRKLAA